MQRSCSKHQVTSSCMSILHSGMSSGPGSTQTHGLPGDTFTSPEYSTDSVDSQSHTKLSSEEVEEESKRQGSKVTNARPFTHKPLVPTHQDVTCAFFSPTMQVPSEPAEGESDPLEEAEPATVKGECRVAVCLSMLVPTTNMRRGDADMLHHSLPTLTTANVGLVCLYLCIQHILDHHSGTVARECGYLHSVRVCVCGHVCMLLVYLSCTCPCLLTLHVTEFSLCMSALYSRFHRGGFFHTVPQSHPRQPHHHPPCFQGHDHWPSPGWQDCSASPPP